MRKYLSIFFDVVVVRAQRHACRPSYLVYVVVIVAVPALNHMNFQLKYSLYVSVSPLLKAFVPLLAAAAVRGAAMAIIMRAMMAAILWRGVWRVVVVGVVMMCCLYGGACGLLCHVFLAIIIIVDRMNSASVM